MASIDDIISGVSGNTRADFSGIAGIPDAYYKGRDEAAKNDLRDAFKGGVPLTPDGQPDFPAMAKVFFQKGGTEQGIAAANLGLAQQNQQFGQRQSGQIRQFDTGQSPEPQQQPEGLGPPSANRGASVVVAKPLNRGGIVSQDGGLGPQPVQSQQAQSQQATITQVLAAQGIPNDQLSAAAASVARQLGVDPTQPLDLQDPQVRNVLAPAVAQIKRMGLGQVQPPQPGDNSPQAPSPQMQPQAQPPMQAQPQMAQPPQMQARPVMQQPAIQPQGQPGPVTNAITTTQAPPTPSRTDQAIAFFSGIMSDPRSPKQNVELAKTRLEALQKNSELTPLQKEYSQAVLQGFKGTMQDYANESESGKAGATERAKADIGEQQEYIKAGKTASDRLTTLNTISNIIGSDKMTLGFGADTALKVQMALKQLGLDVGDLSGPQAISKLNAVLASESAKGVGARPTQFEFRTFLANNPGLSMDKAGNERVIGIYSQLAKREVDLGRLARKNQDNWNNWDNVVENYDKQNPIHDPASGKVITTDSIVAPGQRGPQPSPQQSRQATAPPVPGARQAPDGNFYIPDPSRGPNKYIRVGQ